VAPFVLPEAAARARGREDSLREELRAILATGQFSRELIALEPLLSDHDGAEVAAAALRLLDMERSKPQPPTSVAVQPMTRLYLNVGSMDNVRPGDLVGAITSEAGISKAEMGKVDVRERHSTVEVATSVANNVVSKITGVMIRNRRVLAHVDEGPERPARPRSDDVRLGSREGRERKGPPRDRNARPNRDRPRRNDA
jgi:ATP-dependent RNA helicase DeaD